MANESDDWPFRPPFLPTAMITRQPDNHDGISIAGEESGKAGGIERRLSLQLTHCENRELFNKNQPNLLVEAERPTNQPTNRF